MNASADLLRMLEFQVLIYHNAKVCGDWKINEHAPGQSCFHIVTAGSCQLDIPGHITTTLQCGDLLLFPRELPHSMRPVEALQGPQRHLLYPKAGDKPGTGLLCAEITFQHQSGDFLLDSLPQFVLIRNDSQNPWLDPLVKLILHASVTESIMSEVTLSQLCELLFILTIDQLLSDSAFKQGVLALQADKNISKSLNFIHADPGKTWTLAEMASLAAQSRTLFCRNFRKLSGLTPMQYLTWWRMQLAWDYLRTGHRVEEVSGLVGYKSIAGFSRAFKASFKVNAGQVRRNQNLVQPQSFQNLGN